jgi:hypothetical protein
MTVTTLVNQNTAAPTEKVKAAIIAGKLVTVAFGLLAIFMPEVFERIPAGFEMAVGGLITSVITDVVAYFKREKV